MLDKRMFHQDVLKQIRIDTYDMVSAPRTMLEEAQRLADSNGKTYFVGAKYEPNPDFKEPESLRGVLDPNPMLYGRRTRLSGEFCISDSREEVLQGGFGSLIWVNPSKHDRKGVAEFPAVLGGGGPVLTSQRPGAQWKLTLIVGNLPADVILSGEEVYAAAVKYFMQRGADRTRIAFPVDKGSSLVVCDVMEVEEYKPIDRSPEDAA